MNIYQKMAFAVAGVVLSLTSLETRPVQAAQLYNFAVNVESGALSGDTGSGTFVYDDSTLKGIGTESFPVSSLAFTFLGTNYSQTDDLGYPSFPVVSFQNGSFLGLNYSVSTLPISFSIAQAQNSPVGGNNFNYFTGSDINSDSGAGAVNYTAVPEPSTGGGELLFLSFVVLGAGLQLRRKPKLS